MKKANRHRRATTINALTDNIFLEIFSFCLHNPSASDDMAEWQRLVRVCRRWRQIIYASPCYLDLLLHCSESKHKKLSCWPAFPISMRYSLPPDEKPVIALFNHSDRVRRINLIGGQQMENVVAAMRSRSFPVLTHLELLHNADDNVVLPVDGFLGGSAPCLQQITIVGFFVPELSTRLSSCRDLVSLRLSDIGHTTPMAMVASLAVLTKLQTLDIDLWFSDDEERTRHPPTRVVLPALSSLTFPFRAQREYMEDFVACIDAPRLDSISVDVEHCELGNPSIPQLTEFVGRSDFKFRDAEVEIFYSDVVKSRYRRVSPGGYESKIWMTSEIRHDLDVAQAVNQTSAMNSNVDRLTINAVGLRFDSRDKIEWLDLLLSFTAVETLHVCVAFTKEIVHAFEEMSMEMATQVLPALGSIHLEGEPTETTNKLSIIFRKCGRIITVTNEPVYLFSMNRRSESTA